MSKTAIKCGTGHKKIRLSFAGLIILAVSFAIPATIIALKGGKIKIGNLINIDIPEKKEIPESDPETD